MRGSFARWLVLATATLAAGDRGARGAELTDVASSFDDDNPFDLRLRVGYWYEETNASIKREGEVAGADEVQLFKDLRYHHSRHTMAVRAEVGIFQDLATF